MAGAPGHQRILKRLNRRLFIVLIAGLIPASGVLAYWWLLDSPTHVQLDSWADKRIERASLLTALTQPCPGAPFLLPSSGFVGFLYGDHTPPYTPFNPHPGIDIFGDGDPGVVPIYAAYDGYLTRLPDWISSVIIRIPHDPLNPARQIWTYYTHMASKSGDQSFISSDFPPGTTEKAVKQGTLLGYQGLYSGSEPPILMHLHFSIVIDKGGSFTNETRFNDTIDPSPYFGMTLNTWSHPTIPVRCGA